MISSIGDSTASLLALALDATTLRQQAIAQNIANIGNASYRRQAVNFEQQLDTLRSTVHAGLPLQTDQIAAVRPHIEVADRSEVAGEIDVELEAADLSETVLQNQVLLKAVSRHYGLLSLAITEGKR
jgi:flagellar basal-body rod protein FlgB